MAESLLGPLADLQFYKDMLRGLTDAGNRGFVGGLLGAPVDMATGVINAGLMGGGVLGQKMGLLSAAQMPDPIERPVGGSEWIGQKMQDAGMVSDQRNAPAEMLAGLLGPGALNKAGKAVWAMEQNAAAPTPMNAASRRQAGAIKMPDAPAKFPEDFRESAVVNRKGDPLVLYHGSADDFLEFDPRRLGENTKARDAAAGFHFSDNHADASLYADMAAKAKAVRDDPSRDGYGAKGIVRKFYLNLKNPLIVGMDESIGNAGGRTQEFLDNKMAAKRYAVENGMDGIIYPQGTGGDSGYTAIAFKPDQIRRIKGLD